MGGMMPTLRMYALGRLRVFWDQIPLDFPTKRTQDLLCFLLLHLGQTLDRDLVAEQLWPMRAPGKARRCLSTALWRLRQVLEPLAGNGFLLSDHATLMLNPNTNHWFDVAVFQERALTGLAEPVPGTQSNPQSLEEALELYKGDLLEGSHEDWCLVERERLRLLHLRVLKRLLRLARLSAAFDAAVSYGHILLALDPLQEDVHRELMRCYTASGQRPLALEQYLCCQNTLRRELAIDPMPETQQLYQRIRNGRGTHPLPAFGEDCPTSLVTALSQFRQALDALESTWHALQAATSEFRETKDPTSAKHT
jgi:DNA-binding SARP family transcriptional activator